jgi:hypothetical protein
MTGALCSSVIRSEAISRSLGAVELPLEDDASPARMQATDDRESANVEHWDVDEAPIGTAAMHSVVHGVRDPA